MKNVQFKLETIPNTLTKGKIYETYPVYNDKHLAIIDDAGDEHLIGNIRNDLGTFEGDKSLNERFNWGAAIDPALDAPEPKQLRVAHYPQVPCAPFTIPVTSIEDAQRVINLLADYDQFQYQERIKGDYSNTSFVQQFEDGQWVDWADDETGISNVDEYFEFINEHPAQESVQ